MAGAGGGTKIVILATAAGLAILAALMFYSNPWRTPQGSLDRRRSPDR